MPGCDWGQVCLQIHPQEAQEEEGSQAGTVNGQHGGSHQRQPQEIWDHGHGGRFRCLPEQVRSFFHSHNNAYIKTDRRWGCLCEQVRFVQTKTRTDNLRLLALIIAMSKGEV